MERTGSSSLISSLSVYGNDEEMSDDEREDGFSAVDNISDEDGEGLESRASSRPVLDDDYNSGASIHEKESVKPPRKPTRLVSYARDGESDDEDDEDDEEDEESEEEKENDGIDSEEMNANETESNQLDSSLNPEQASLLSRSVRDKSIDEIELPPEPPGKCSKHLQEKIARLYLKMRREGLNTVSSIERRKDFRNPSLCEKLIEYCGIDEKGTNYPVDVFDPHMWGKESFYDALDKAQKVEMEKWEKERKERTKIEFMTGTKKSGSSSTDGQPDEKKRKSKWDAQPAGVVPPIMNPGVVNLTSTATGTKATVIPAIGSLGKSHQK